MVRFLSFSFENLLYIMTQSVPRTVQWSKIRKTSAIKNVCTSGCTITPKVKINIFGKKFWDSIEKISKNVFEQTVLCYISKIEIELFLELCQTGWYLCLIKYFMDNEGIFECFHENFVRFSADFTSPFFRNYYYYY